MGAMWEHMAGTWPGHGYVLMALMKALLKALLKVLLKALLTVLIIHGACKSCCGSRQ